MSKNQKTEAAKKAGAAKTAAGKPPKKTVAAAFAAGMVAVLLIVSCVISFVALGPADGEQSSSPVDTASAFAVKKVTAFEEGSVRTNAVFTDAILKRVCGAALAYKGDDSALETIVSTLGFESIAVTDEKGKITASYPDGLKGKLLKDDEDTLSLTPVAKDITGKTIGVIKPTEDEGVYKVTAAAKRTDREAGGAVAVVLLTDTYGAVLGTNLADDCGDNVIIEKDGERVSSSFAEAGDKTIEALGVKDNDKAVDITVDGKTYTAKAAEAGEYRVLTAVEPQAAGGGSKTPFLIICITDLVLAVVGIAVLLAVGKSKAK